MRYLKGCLGVVMFCAFGLNVGAQSNTSLGSSADDKGRLNVGLVSFPATTAESFDPTSSGAQQPGVQGVFRSTIGRLISGTPLFAFTPPRV